MNNSWSCLKQWCHTSCLCKKHAASCSIAYDCQAGISMSGHWHMLHVPSPCSQQMPLPCCQYACRNLCVLLKLPLRHSTSHLTIVAQHGDLTYLAQRTQRISMVLLASTSQNPFKGHRSLLKPVRVSRGICAWRPSAKAPVIHILLRWSACACKGTTTVGTRASLYPAAASCMGHLGLLNQLILLCPFVKQQGESLLSCCL